MTYLTDQSRGPFKVETTFVEARNPPWDNSYWTWKLLGADGKCHETGTGYATQKEAHMSALAVQNNEVA